MRPVCSGPHQLTPEGSRPPVATSPRTHGPLIPDREALRASAHSLCRLPADSYFIVYSTTMHKPDTASKGVARKVTHSSCFPAGRTCASEHITHAFRPPVLTAADVRHGSITCNETTVVMDLAKTRPDPDTSIVQILPLRGIRTLARLTLTLFACETASSHGCSWVSPPIRDNVLY